MKLVVLGGGGVRSPFLAKSIISNAKLANVTEVVFMDNNEEQLRIFGELSKQVAYRMDSSIDFTYTMNAEDALTGADYIITTLRVGGDESRIFDERLALNLGVLGQETTGAGGFGMAMRSIAVLKEYCALARRVAKPNTLIFNFTNPSGIVTQALRDEGFENVYGICDAPSEFIKQLIKFTESTPETFSIQCFGLNHLSWFNNIKKDGIDITDDLVRNPQVYIDTDMRTFDEEIIRLNGNSFINEYLQYYFFREEKIKKIKDAKMTRGELIKEVNDRLYEKIKDMDIQKDPEKAFLIFHSHYMERENSYGFLETGIQRIDLMKAQTLDEFIATPDAGGYAAVALNFIKAYKSGVSCEMVLSIPNEGAIPILNKDDVVEISCVIEKGSVKPCCVEEKSLSVVQRHYITTMKAYERAVVKAIKNRSKEQAIQALMINPLVNSYTIAKDIVEAYTKKYEAVTGRWN